MKYAHGEWLNKSPSIKRKKSVKHDAAEAEWFMSWREDPGHRERNAQFCCAAVGWLPGVGKAESQSPS